MQLTPPDSWELVSVADTFPDAFVPHGSVCDVAFRRGAVVVVLDDSTQPFIVSLDAITNDHGVLRRGVFVNTAKLRLHVVVGDADEVYVMQPGGLCYCCFNAATGLSNRQLRVGGVYHMQLRSQGPPQRLNDDPLRVSDVVVEGLDFDFGSMSPFCGDDVEALQWGPDVGRDALCADGSEVGGAIVSGSGSARGSDSGIASGSGTASGSASGSGSANVSAGTGAGAGVDVVAEVDDDVLVRTRYFSPSRKS